MIGRRKRKRMKKQNMIIIMSAVVLISILTVGYAAFSTNLTLTVKGNYTRIMSIDDLKKTAVTSGDGLYDNGDGTYTYKGGAPANFIKLDTDIYRIMGIEKDNTLKVIKEDSIGNIVWDPGYSSSISGITNIRSNNGTRYSNVSTDYCYNSSTYPGCKSWGSSSSTLDLNGENVTLMLWEARSTTLKDLPKYDSYINVYLNGGKYLTPESSGNSDEYQEITGWVEGLSYRTLIEEHSFDIGPIEDTSSQTLDVDINQAHAYTWKGKVGLMTAIDYVKASTNSACTGVYAYVSNSTCYNNSSSHNYLYKSSWQWTISPAYSNSYSNSYIVWRAYSNGSLDSSNTLSAGGVRPVIHLSSDIKLMGTGESASEPYTIAS